MPTDNRTKIAGKYPSTGIIRTAILDEGAPTVSTAFDQMGQSQTVVTWASQLSEGDWVAVSNDVLNTYANCEGSFLVEVPQTGETLVIGQIVSTPKFEAMPATTAAGDSLTKRLAAGIYRTANIEIPWANTVRAAEVLHDGTNATVVGVGATLKWNITGGTANHKLSLIQVASGGVGVIPLNYVAAGTAGDKSDCNVAITAMMMAITGA